MPRACDNRLCYSRAKIQRQYGQGFGEESVQRGHSSYPRRRQHCRHQQHLAPTTRPPANGAPLPVGEAPCPAHRTSPPSDPTLSATSSSPMTGSALASNTAITQLTIEALAAGSITFSQTANTLAISNSEFIGSTGKGIWKMSGGAQNVAAGFSLGDGIGSSGTGTLSGGTLNVGFEEYIGNFGTGFYTALGGIEHDLLFRYRLERQRH